MQFVGIIRKGQLATYVVVDAPHFVRIESLHAEQLGNVDVQALRLAIDTDALEATSLALEDETIVVMAEIISEAVLQIRVLCKTNGFCNKQKPYRDFMFEVQFLFFLFKITLLKYRTLFFFRG